MNFPSEIPQAMLPDVTHRTARKTHKALCFPALTMYLSQIVSPICRGEDNDLWATSSLRSSEFHFSPCSPRSLRRALSDPQADPGICWYAMDQSVRLVGRVQSAAASFRRSPNLSTKIATLSNHSGPTPRSCMTNIMAATETAVIAIISSSLSNSLATSNFSCTVRKRAAKAGA